MLGSTGTPLARLLWMLESSILFLALLKPIKAQDAKILVVGWIRLPVAVLRDAFCGHFEILFWNRQNLSFDLKSSAHVNSSVGLVWPHPSWWRLHQPPSTAGSPQSAWWRGSTEPHCARVCSRGCPPPPHPAPGSNNISTISSNWAVLVTASREPPIIEDSFSSLRVHQVQVYLRVVH